MTATQLAACLILAALIAGVIVVDVIGMIALFVGCRGRWTR